VDLVAALATGAVGSVALARSDISDTLPGVAIAISLVPPLAVAGLTLESGVPSQSLGAFLLFVTNVAATGDQVLIGPRGRTPPPASPCSATTSTPQAERARRASQPDPRELPARTEIERHPSVTRARIFAVEGLSRGAR
jgi:hypothetical protein